LHRLEEIPEGVPGFRRVGKFVSGFLDQRAPDVKRQRAGHVRGQVEAALFGDVVVVLRREQRGRMVVGFLRLHDVGRVGEPVVPGILRNDRVGSGGMGEQVRHVAAGERRDDLLHQGPERNDAEVDDVAARLLVGGDHAFQGVVLLPDEALAPPDVRGLGRGVGNVGPADGSRRGERDGPADDRTPAKSLHAAAPWCFPRPRVGRAPYGWSLVRSQSRVMASVTNERSDGANVRGRWYADMRFMQRVYATGAALSLAPAVSAPSWG